MKKILSIGFIFLFQAVGLFGIDVDGVNVSTRTLALHNVLTMVRDVMHEVKAQSENPEEMSEELASVNRALWLFKTIMTEFETGTSKSIFYRFLNLCDYFGKFEDGNIEPRYLRRFKAKVENFDRYINRYYRRLERSKTFSERESKLRDLLYEFNEILLSDLMDAKYFGNDIFDRVADLVIHRPFELMAAHPNITACAILAIIIVLVIYVYKAGKKEETEGDEKRRVNEGGEDDYSDDQSGKGRELTEREKRDIECGCKLKIPYCVDAIKRANVMFAEYEAAVKNKQAMALDVSAIQRSLGKVTDQSAGASCGSNALFNVLHMDEKGNCEGERDSTRNEFFHEAAIIFMASHLLELVEKARKEKSESMGSKYEKYSENRTAKILETYEKLLRDNKILDLKKEIRNLFVDTGTTRPDRIARLTKEISELETKIKTAEANIKPLTSASESGKAAVKKNDCGFFSRFLAFFFGGSTDTIDENTSTDKNIEKDKKKLSELKTEKTKFEKPKKVVHSNEVKNFLDALNVNGPDFKFALGSGPSVSFSNPITLKEAEERLPWLEGGELERLFGSLKLRGLNSSLDVDKWPQVSVVKDRQEFDLWAQSYEYAVGCVKNLVLSLLDYETTKKKIVDQSKTILDLIATRLNPSNVGADGFYPNNIFVGTPNWGVCQAVSKEINKEVGKAIEKDRATWEAIKTDDCAIAKKLIAAIFSDEFIKRIIDTQTKDNATSNPGSMHGLGVIQLKYDLWKDCTSQVSSTVRFIAPKDPRPDTRAEDRTHWLAFNVIRVGDNVKVHWLDSINGYTNADSHVIKLVSQFFGTKPSDKELLQFQVVIENQKLEKMRSERKGATEINKQEELIGDLVVQISTIE